jgi:hypothetical protein
MHPSGAEQAAEKVAFGSIYRYWPLQGLKPIIDLIGFIGTTKVVPCYKALRIRLLNEFFRSL